MPETISDLEPDDLHQLAKKAHLALEHCHQLGVFHHDICMPNIIFTPGKSALIVDWENATLDSDKTNDNPDNWRRSDIDSMHSALKAGLGIEDPRPPPPDSFFQLW